MESAGAGCLGANSSDGLGITKWEHIGQDVGPSGQAILGPEAYCVEDPEPHGELKSIRAAAQLWQGILLG